MLPERTRDRRASQWDDDNVHGSDKSGFSHGSVGDADLLERAGNRKTDTAEDTADDQCPSVGGGYVGSRIRCRICGGRCPVGFVDQRNKKQQDKSTDKVSDGVKGKGTDIFHSDTLGDKRGAPDKSC